MTEYYYRYRSTKALLDEFHELDNQEIYFSPTDKLNDPMEGFKDVVWSGDKIVWRNLLRHYLLCLLQTSLYSFVAKESFDPAVLKNNIVFSFPNGLPTAELKDLYEAASVRFLSDPIAEGLVSAAASRTSPIRRSELTSYLRTLHGPALNIVMSELRKRHLLPPHSAEPGESFDMAGFTNRALEMIHGVSETIDVDPSAEKLSEAIFSANEATVAQVELIHEYNLSDDQKITARVFLTKRFPSAYVSALEKLMHRDWYVACFTKTAENHSMWSTYADGHRGACLIFKTEPDASGTPTLTIERVTGVGGTKNGPSTYYKSNVPHKLVSVNYTANYPTVDFFRSLGAISQANLNTFWYRGEDGTFSTCRESIYADEESWRNEYWKTFEGGAFFKTKEWSHEEEYRIIVHSGFDMTSTESRKLKYRFQELAGIVFGARTSIDDKLKIMKIVDEKCAKEGRTDFEFYEIRYLHTESRFQLFPLDLLKVRKK